MTAVWDYFRGDQSEILGWLRTTVWLAVLPLVIGLAISLPVGWLASRYRWTYPPVITLGGALYTIPSVVLFIVMPGILHTRILDTINVAVALTVYCFALLVRVVADGLSAVSGDTLAAASAIGFSGWRRFVSVQLPVAVPVIGAGVRVAAVSNVSLIAVASTIGVSQLGQLFVAGDNAAVGGKTPIILGLIMFVLIALVLDVVVLIGIRLLAPVATGGVAMTALADGLDLPSLSLVPGWLTTASNWWGPTGLAVALRQHVVYTLAAVIIAVLIALPIGLVVGHTGRGVVVVVGVANALRAVPGFGLLLLLVVLLTPKIHHTQAVSGLIPTGGLPYLIPVEIVLVVLAIPPILTNTYAGVQGVDPNVRDAARGIGMSGSRIIRQIEFPIALPLILAGLRSAVLQVIATATVAGFVPFLGGLGGIIFNGISQINDPKVGYPAAVGAGIVVAALAVVADLLLLGVLHLVVSRGVSGRFATHAVVLPELAEVAPRP